MSQLSPAPAASGARAGTRTRPAAVPASAAAPPASAPAPRRPRALSRRLRGAQPETGMATAEYAVATVAACGFGAVLIKAITDERVLGLVINVISKALRLGLG